MMQYTKKDNTDMHSSKKILPKNMLYGIMLFICVFRADTQKVKQQLKGFYNKKLKKRLTSWPLIR